MAMLAFTEELVREVAFAHGIVQYRLWSLSYVESLLPDIMLRMKNKGYEINGAYSERALRNSIIMSTISVDSEWD